MAKQLKELNKLWLGSYSVKVRQTNTVVTYKFLGDNLYPLIMSIGITI